MGCVSDVFVFDHSKSTHRHCVGVDLCLVVILIFHFELARKQLPSGTFFDRGIELNIVSLACCYPNMYGMIAKP